MRGAGPRDAAALSGLGAARSGLPPPGDRAYLHGVPLISRTSRLDKWRGWIGLGIAAASLLWSVFTYVVPALKLTGAGGTDQTSASGGIDAVSGITKFQEAAVQLPWWVLVGIWCVEAAATAFMFTFCDALIRDRGFHVRLKGVLRLAAGVVTSTHLFVFHLWFFWDRLRSPGVAASVVFSAAVVYWLWKRGRD